MRFVHLVTLICMVVFSNAVHASSAAVVFVNPGKKGEVFWDMVTGTMQAAARDLDLELEVLYGNRNRLEMRRLGLELTERADPPDYIVVVNEEQFGVEIVEAANANGINSLFLLNDAIGQDAKRLGKPRERLEHWLGSITPDNAAAGERMVHALVQAARQNQQFSADGKLHFFAIGGDQSTPASLDRMAGMKKGFAQYDDVVIDRIVYASWNSKEAKKLSLGYLRWASRNGIVPAGVWSANDPIAFGAMDAFEQAGYKAGQDTFFVGLNWSKEALDRILDGRMLMSDGGHFLAGGWSMVMLRDHADGIDFSEGNWRFRFDMNAMNRELAAGFIDRFGSQDWEQIDFKKFRRSKGGKYNFQLPELKFSSEKPKGRNGL